MQFNPHSTKISSRNDRSSLRKHRIELGEPSLPTRVMLSRINPSARRGARVSKVGNEDAGFESVPFMLLWQQRTTCFSL